MIKFHPYYAAAAVLGLILGIIQANLDAVICAIAAIVLIALDDTIRFLKWRKWRVSK